MKHVVWVALLLVMAAPILPAVTLAQNDGPVAAVALSAAGDQGIIQPQVSRWYRYDVAGAVEQVDFTLHFWPNDAAQYQQVRLELYTQSPTGEMTPLGQGFAMKRQEEGLPVGRRVWMGWLVPGSYLLRVSNESGNR